MDPTLYFSLVVFVISMSITPGPNNLMVMSSSILFGFRATLPHWVGVNIGFSTLLLASVFGLGELVDRFPQVLWIVKSVGALWLIWMSSIFIRSAFNPKPVNGIQTEASRPFRIHEGALFQLINPKALLMTISASGAFIALADVAAERALIMVPTFFVFGAPCGLLWMAAGGTLHRFLGDPGHARWINAVIAALLLFTVWIVVSG